MLPCWHIAINTLSTLGSLFSFTSPLVDHLGVLGARRPTEGHALGLQDISLAVEGKEIGMVVDGCDVGQSDIGLMVKALSATTSVVSMSISKLKLAARYKICKRGDGIASVTAISLRGYQCVQHLS